MRILFIEDVPEFSQIVAEILRERGHTVTIVDNADDAVDIIPKVNEWDVVILDLMMMLGKTIASTEAKETGIAIYNRLRKTNKTINVLILTALDKNVFWDSINVDEHVRFFPKPLYPDKTDFFNNVEVWK